MGLFRAFKSFDIKNVYKGILPGNAAGRASKGWSALLKLGMKHATKEWQSAKTKLKDIPGTNFELGLMHLKQGNLDDAIFRFRMVIYLKPDNYEAYYNLAKCLIIAGDNKSAEEYLNKAQKLQSDSEDINYLIEKIRSPQNIQTVPKKILEEQISWHEEKPEDKELRLALDKALVQGVLINITHKNPNLNVLDIGCGVGNRGNILKEREVLKNIIGVELSTKNANLAIKQIFDGEAVYSAVEKDDALQYLQKNRKKFDVVFASNIFSCTGDLKPLFSNITKNLQESALFATIIDSDLAINSGYEFDIQNDKFVHSISYLTETIEKSGLKLQEKKTKEIAGGKYCLIIAAKK